MPEMNLKITGDASGALEAIREVQAAIDAMPPITRTCNLTLDEAWNWVLDDQIPIRVRRRIAELLRNREI